MCGIACVVKSKKSGQYCYDALEKLEYRGYDSAGIAGLTRSGIEVYKSEGVVKNIKDFAYNFKADLVIAHTRWATHGAPSKINAHPHLSYDNTLAIVHNGIIENYLDIKAKLEDKGIKNVSDTDSECIVNLIASKEGKILEKVKDASQELVGSYAIAVLDSKSKCIVATRKKSPLYIASTTEGEMIASDIICFAGKCKSYYALKENEYAVVSKHKIKVYDEELMPIKPQYTPLKSDAEAVSKQGYSHFMEKEIHEIPAVIKRIYNEYKSGALISKAVELFKGIDNVVLVGCGTAYHACMYGAKVLKKSLGKGCEAYIASEYKYSDPIIKNTLAIFVSQSGETADTLGCATLLKDRGAKTLAVTNVCHSALAGLCDEVLPVFAGAEIGVASTKAYVAQILVLYILSQFLKYENYELKDIEHLADQAVKMIDIDEEILDLVTSADRVFFIGRQFDSITALEGALKLKEITYKSAEGYPAGELKHGTIALIENNTPVVVFATDRALLEKTLGGSEEVRARGAKVILVAPEDYPVYSLDYKIDLPSDNSSEISSILSIIPFQVLAYHVSLRLGFNPDKPRNLAKSVTVE